MNEFKEEKTESNTKSVSININEEKPQERNYNYDSIPFGISKIPVNDYLIIIKKLPILGIHYFKFGSTVNFYICQSFKKREYKLSEMPTPFFTIGPECKQIFIINYNYLY